MNMYIYMYIYTYIYIYIYIWLPSGLLTQCKLFQGSGISSTTILHKLGLELVSRYVSCGVKAILPATILSPKPGSQEAPKGPEESFKGP